MASGDQKALIATEIIERRIHYIRRHKVMLDSDLAELYGVSTGRLNEQVTRNIERFPDDFMFTLTTEEHRALISQIATSKAGRGGRRKPPRVFTEQGVAMLSGVLRSPRAIQVNVAIMRTFVRLRRMLASNEELARKLALLEEKYDEHFRVVFEAIKQLMEPEEEPREPIGFRKDDS